MLCCALCCAALCCAVLYYTVLSGAFLSCAVCAVRCYVILHDLLRPVRLGLGLLSAEVLDEHVEAVLRVHLLLLEGGALSDELVLAVPNLTLTMSIGSF